MGMAIIIAKLIKQKETRSAERRSAQKSGSCAKITGLFTQGAILRKDNESTQQVDLD